MAAKKKPKKSDDEEMDLPDLPPMFRTMEGFEKTLMELRRAIEEKGIKTEEELNTFMEGLVDSGRPLGGFEPRTPLEQAQEIIYEAFDTPSSAKRVKLAKKALSISPDCADAYVLLAQGTSSVTKAIEYYQQGVAAGERAIGLEQFAELKGHFWGFLETRPYMRAREGLALMLWEYGDEDVAIDHLEEMLELNPNDNQGIRYHLLSIYLDLEDDDEAYELLERYKNDRSAQWLYSGALVAYRRGERKASSSKKLKAALDYNPHVPLFLLGRKRLPEVLAPFYSPRDENEAAGYVMGALKQWFDSPGALDWLREGVDRKGG